METKIVLISVNSFDSRISAEYIENMQLTLTTDLQNRKEIIQHILQQRGYELKESDIEVWNLPDFIDRVNDQEFNSDEYFISYIKV